MNTTIFIIVVFSIMSAIVGWMFGTLQARCEEAERLLDVALHDLYDIKFQFFNLLLQDNHGALGYVYVLKSDSGHYKIGKTANPDDRIETFEIKLPMEVKYLVLIQSHNYHRLEALLHRQYRHKRINGEWFNLSPTDLMLLENFPGNIIKPAA